MQEPKRISEYRSTLTIRTICSHHSFHNEVPMQFIRVLLALIFLTFFSNINHSYSQSSATTEEDTTKKSKDRFTSATFSGLKLRCIGPALLSGRIVDIAVHPTDHSTFYLAVACGGVWKTTNAGISFAPIFENQKSFSVGCVAIDPNNPHVVWVGSGENNSQRSVSYGDGVYKSEDDGKSWKNVGLKKSEHIGKIVLDPKHSNTAYVAAQGPLWGPGGDRGLFKTTDGGKNWNAVLTISENTGVSDIVMDPRDPNYLIVSAYQRRRHVWTLIDGGPESNLYRTTNGGQTWDTLRNGIPGGDKGRIGLAMSPVHPDVVYAIIELPAGKGGVFRSQDRGASWEKRSDYVTDSPQYYQEIVCDPKNVDRLFALNTILSVSDDGGKTFRALGNRFRHVDDHALWINPNDTRHYRVGGDGGYYESFDAGATWRHAENLPITQFYRVAVDNAEPFYNVYGGTQDNASLGGPSRTTKHDGIMNEDWLNTQGGDGFESQIDPKDPNIVYAQAQYGDLVRFDKKSGERLSIQPQPELGEESYRWNWDSPLLISPHNNTTLYFCANLVFKSDDRGNSWKAISPDLSRRIERNALAVMGKVWMDDAVAKNASTSLFGNIVAFDASPLKQGHLYVGTDDGLIQISEDDGKNWRKIEKFPGVPETTYVSFLKSSTHDENVLYATFDNHKRADFKPYIMKSADRGRTWKSIVGNLPDNGPVYAIAEDHVNADLLFVGTEFGLYFTNDGGKKWTQLKGGFPTIAVKDIAIQQRENDLALATFGRSFYVIDDYSPLRSASKEMLEKEAVIFPIKDALMYIPSDARSRYAQGETFYVAENPPFGATFTYYLKESIKTKRDLRKEAEKEIIKKKQTPPYPTHEQLRAEDEEAAPHLVFTITDASGAIIRKLTAAATQGMQRITWDLRYPDLSPVRTEDGGKGSAFLVMPGEYFVSLAKVADGVTTELVQPVKFNTKLLNNTSLPADDRAALVAFQRKITRLQRSVLGAQQAANDLKSRLGSIKAVIQSNPSITEEIKAEWRTINDKLRSHLRVMNGDESRSKRNENQTPSLIGRLMSIAWGQWACSSAPSEMNKIEYERVVKQFTPLLAELQSLIEVDVKKLEAKLDGIGAPWTPGRIPSWNPGEK